MKIAIIGNMNNNGFALMRYFRDLGADAHLLLYANDSIDTLSHFKPEDDAWDYSKWAPYVHQTPIINSIYTGANGVWSSLFYMWLMIARRLRGEQLPKNVALSAGSLRRALDGYDYYIGSGIAPAVFYRCKRPLHIFYPYSTGVEFLGHQVLTSKLPKMSLIKRILINKCIANQKKGVLLAQRVINSELSLTASVLNSIGRDFNRIAVPMVYREPKSNPRCSEYSDLLINALSIIGSVRFVVFSSSRQLWVNPGHFIEEQWKRESKNSDWLIRGFAKLIHARPNQQLLLVLMEYGPDVTASKKLSKELGVDRFVLWVPKLSRKELFVLMREVSVIAGEFKDVDEMIWGGSGWEALASSKPLIHSFRFDKSRYEDLYGIPRPPVLAVTRKEDVYDHLLNMLDNPQSRYDIGKASGDWFNQYNGIGLAKQWLDLLTIAPIEKHSKESTYRMMNG